jgi:predicted nucleotidyltransferase
MTFGTTLKKMINKSLIIPGIDKIVLNVYTFGSYAKISHPNDIDILLIYAPRTVADYTLVIKFRQVISILAKIILHLTADIVLLTEAEEQQVDFINRESAKLIWSRKKLNKNQDLLEKLKH